METSAQTTFTLDDADIPSTKDSASTGVGKGTLSPAVVCVAQIVVAIVFIVASLFNLTFHPNENREFWLSMLWLNAGYLVPTPAFKAFQKYRTP